MTGFISLHYDNGKEHTPFVLNIDKINWISKNKYGKAIINIDGIVGESFGESFEEIKKMLENLSWIASVDSVNSVDS